MSRMRGAVSPLPQYPFMAWCSVKKQGQTKKANYCDAEIFKKRPFKE
jgi:hypothetical protein